MKSLVGKVFKLKVPCLGNDKGAVGVVFNEYPSFDNDGTGVQIIFENGNYDGFSPTEQRDFLEEIGDSAKGHFYVFTNVLKLSKDFENGYWKEAFEFYKKYNNE